MISHSFEAADGQYMISSFTTRNYKDPNSKSVPVHLSFLDYYYFLDADINHTYSVNEWGCDAAFCLNIGRELHIYARDNPKLPIDKRIFQCEPTCHSFRSARLPPHKPGLLIGLINGEIHLISQAKKDGMKIFNEEKLVDKTAVTCLSWVPGCSNQFLAGHLSGYVYLYDEKLSNVASAPLYESFKRGMGFAVCTCKVKSTRNPLYRWSFGNPLKLLMHPTDTLKTLPNNQRSDSALTQAHNYPDDTQDAQPGPLVIQSVKNSVDESPPVTQFAFSPCGTYLAIVTQDGYLRVLDYHAMELYGFMRSYFAGLLCLDWSPDGRLIAVGGQDDLITIWSMTVRAVVCRGQGHRSWVSSVRFDPFLCPSPTASPASTQPSKILSDSNRDENDENETEAVPAPIYSSAFRNYGPVTTNGSYRLGSVGQDTLLCLWDITEDVLRQGAMFVEESLMQHVPSSPREPVSPNLSRASSPSSQDRIVTGAIAFDVLVSKANDPISSIPSIPTTSTAAAAATATTTTGSTTMFPAVTSPNASTLAPNNTNRNMSNLFGLLSLNKRKLSAVNGSKGNYLGSRFTLPRNRSHTAGGRNHPQLERNATWHSPSRDPSGANTDTATPSSTLGENMNSVVRLGEGGQEMPLNEKSLFGSPLCPHFGDVPVLEPAASTVLHQPQLTDIVFRHNGIYTVCQQGLLRCWCRPPKLKKMESVSSQSVSVSGDNTPVSGGIPPTSGDDSLQHSGSSMHSKTKSVREDPSAIVTQSNAPLSSPVSHVLSPISCAPLDKNASTATSTVFTGPTNYGSSKQYSGPHTDPFCAQHSPVNSLSQRRCSSLRSSNYEPPQLFERCNSPESSVLNAVRLGATVSTSHTINVVSRRQPALSMSAAGVPINPRPECVTNKTIHTEL